MLLLIMMTVTTVMLIMMIVINTLTLQWKTCVIYNIRDENFPVEAQ